jgi:hypothetical protein
MAHRKEMARMNKKIRKTICSVRESKGRIFADKFNFKQKAS